MRHPWNKKLTIFAKLMRKLERLVELGSIFNQQFLYRLSRGYGMSLFAKSAQENWHGLVQSGNQ